MWYKRNCSAIVLPCFIWRNRTRIMHEASCINDQNPPKMIQGLNRIHKQNTMGDRMIEIKHWVQLFFGKYVASPSLQYYYTVSADQCQLRLGLFNFSSKSAFVTCRSTAKPALIVLFAFPSYFKKEWETPFARQYI